MAGRRIYTGTVPDFAAGDVGGMKISGVQGGSPAEKAGLTLRIYRAKTRLPDLVRRVRSLESRLQALESADDD